MNNLKTAFPISKAIVAVLTLALFSGCSAYRSASGISVPTIVTQEHKGNVVITEGSLSDKDCTQISNIEASVSKTTILEKDPKREHANYILSVKARELNANAVTNVTYSSGIGFTTWGYMDAKGIASRCKFDVPEKRSSH